MTESNTMVRSKKRQVLIVDNMRPRRTMMAGLMQRLGFEPLVAGDGDAALAQLRPGIALVLLDLNLPDMPGMELAERIRATPEVGDIPMILLTTPAGREDRRQVAEGICDFIAKPVDLVELRIRTEAIMQLTDARDERKLRSEAQETEIQIGRDALSEALDEIATMRDRLEAAQVDTLHRLASASEFKDRYATMHIRRVGRLCAITAKAIGLPNQAVQLILRASPLHDLGKLGIPDSILLKPGRLTDREQLIVQLHPEIGAQILGGSSSDVLRAAETIALTHHEWWNGEGYPCGLSGEEIPIFGRICAVADAFDAMTSQRPYKEAYSNDKAIALLKQGRGTQFDPRVLDAFLSCRKEVEQVRQALNERSTSHAPQAVPKSHGRHAITPLPDAEVG